MSKVKEQINASNFVSRDLSWLQFNNRVLDQSKMERRNVLDRLKFMAITASNLDEFFMIRMGSLYNYIDFKKQRLDYCGLREMPFRLLLLEETKTFIEEQQALFKEELTPLFEPAGFRIVGMDALESNEMVEVNKYFNKTIYPMLTPMVYDSYHTFPILMNNRLIFGVVTKELDGGKKNRKKVSFIQVPHNLPRFIELPREDAILFLPIETLIRYHIEVMFKNVSVVSADLFRITRNGDFTLEESDDIEANFLEELQKKLKKRKTGRVVAIQAERGSSTWLMNLLKKRWELDDHNIFSIEEGCLIDCTCLWQIVGHSEFKSMVEPKPDPVAPLNYPETSDVDIRQILMDRDVVLHHPYNNMEPLLELIERSAEDPEVLAIKITIYRLAKESRITTALLKAAENGKHVSVLFEVKARFDEENNLKQAHLLEKAGCYVIYGISSVKTHTKLLLIVQKNGTDVTRFVHMSSGNYNEDTASLYTDIGLLTSKDAYANDVSEFFNAITGHSDPDNYKNLVTAPKNMRNELMELIKTEQENALKGLPAGIVIKVNSLEDKSLIESLYEASQNGVKIKLIVRGICCLRPNRKGLSENIEVISIVGDNLEHSRIYYFHNNNVPNVFVGSADAMVRSFDRRIESLFAILDPLSKQQVINILYYNLKDNQNSYQMLEDGRYQLKKANGSAPFNVHQELYKVTKQGVTKVGLF